jgi:ATP-dependent RNA helicase RhlE
LDLLEQRYVRVDKVSVLVLDEADRMLDMGFAPQINKIFSLLPKPQDRQTMLFSATMPDDIVRIANTHMKMPVRVEVAPQGTTAEHIEQEIYIVRKEDKLRLVGELLQRYPGSVLLFSRTKHGAHKICKALLDMGINAAEIHANKSLAQRIKALEGFKRGIYRVLVATDIAARGIDVTNIELVINFDLPDNAGDYVHRIGRTGRAGREGRAISLATPDQRSDIRDIERLIRKPLQVAKHPKLSVELPTVMRSHTRHFGNRRPRFRR